ncbi:MAG: peptidoglycan-binding protein [Clostridia bacterium]|nr:peptidoglycan-binding protein [Clostridia bacterium]
MTEPLSIPESIVVHLGPPNSNAKNITVSFPEYIKNVASSEIYPTWPKEAITANVLAQISFALNRIYTEHYRSRGYDFDITSLSDYDQAYNPQRSIFENVGEIVDNNFNNYIAKGEQVFPMFTPYCDGKSNSCQGLSQWGTVDLAEQGYSPLQILQYYYGNDIRIIENAPIENIPQSYPGSPLRRGDTGLNVMLMQVDLNRIARSYPTIGIIPEETLGYFGPTTELSVKEFQRIFNLTQDGIVGKSTWYKILYVYIAVKKLEDLNSEEVQIENIPKAFRTTVKEGDRGNIVSIIQYMLNIVGVLDNNIPTLKEDGIFGAKTKSAVAAFQRAYGIKADGIVNRETWDKLSNAYSTYKATLPLNEQVGLDQSFPGKELAEILGES